MEDGGRPTHASERGAAPDAVRVEVIRDPELLAPLAEAWDALAVAAGRPLSSPWWLLPWWRHMRPAGARLFAVCAWRGTDLIGVAPLHRVRRGTMAEYRLLGTGMAVRNAPLAAPGEERAVAAAIARALARARPAAGALRFDQIDADSPWPALIAGAWPSRPRPRVVTEGSISAPTITIHKHDFDSWMASLKQKVRNNKRRSRRVLGEAGATVAMAGPDDVGPLLDELLRLHAAKFGDRSALSRPEAAAWLHEAAAELVPRERFRLWHADLDGRVIGAHMSIAAGGHLASWNGGWDPGHATLAPLKMVKLAAIEDAIRRGESCVDLGEDATPSKTPVADRDDPVARVVLLPRDARRPLALLRAAPDRASRAARSAARRAPAPVRAALGRGMGALRRTGP